MSIFDSALSGDGQFAFTDADAMGGESITYTPKGGAARSINAIIDRNPPVKREGNGDWKRPDFVVAVRNDSTYGIAATDSTLVGGSLTFAPKKGGSIQVFVVGHGKVISQDGGMISILIG